MNTLVVIMVIVVVVWTSIYTFSYAIWTIKKNKAGGIALIVLSVVCVVLPLYLLWTRR